MTTADLLRAEGEAKGRAAGRAEPLTQLLTIKFGTLPDSVRARLQVASAEELTAWTERVLSATGLDEIFT